jgi:NAD-dependent deacetylase
MGKGDLDSKIQNAADMIMKSKRIVVFTGAGISTESGIPDFRSPGGIWTKFDPDDFTIRKFMTNGETRRKQWKILVEGGLFQDIKPNKAHMAIAEMESMGKLECVITQNIDDLHQKAGNSRDIVFELHGNMQWIRCMDCGDRYPIEHIKKVLKTGVEEPECENCGGILKPDVVFFGEELPADTVESAMYHAGNCDLLIVVGSSLVVQPAAFIPSYAQDRGASLVIINIGPTPYDRLAEILINESAGKTMEAIVERVKNNLKKR